METNYRLVSKIEGIHCLGCLNRINSKLSSLGATNVDVDLPLKIIKVDFLGDEEDANKYIDAINDLGYNAEKLAVFDPEEVFN